MNGIVCLYFSLISNEGKHVRDRLGAFIIQNQKEVRNQYRAHFFFYAHFYSHTYD